MHRQWPSAFNVGWRLLFLGLVVVIAAVSKMGVAVEPQRAAVAPAAAPLAKAFRLHDVRLLEGPFKQGQDRAVKYLLSLDPDRLLAGFREDAGLSPRAPRYGGWEALGVAGHSLGHYLSACSLAYAATGDQRFFERVEYMVGELAACQAANRNGYVSAIPDGKRIYAEIAVGDIRSAGFDLNGSWVPNYTMHKVVAGLLDSYRLCRIQQALEVAKALADWFDATHAALSEEQMQKVLVAEHGGINESFADLYALTGDIRYLQLSKRFHHRAILDPLADGVDILPGKHANTQIPKIIGVAVRHALTGDEQDRAIAEFFWKRVVNHHTYVTGGHCDHEHFGEPDKLNDRLSADTTETCNVYNMLKLTEHVFGWSGDSQAADYYERALLNHMRATQHPDGRVVYNLSLKPGHHKVYQTPYDSFTCCVGTGMENHVRYGAGIYFHDADGLWVNLFLPSEVDWKERGVKIRQETKWPFTESTELAFTVEKPQELTLRLRAPYWSKQGLAVEVNGKAAPAEESPSGYVEIRRVWRSGDRVRFSFPMSLRTESMPDNPNRIAIFFGPTLLAADLGAPSDAAAATPGYVPVLVPEDRAVADWVKPISLSERVFQTVDVGRPRNVELVPFFNLHDRRYTVYFDAFTSRQWAERQADIRAEQERLAAIAKNTIDELRIGEMQSERDHRLIGQQTAAGEAFGRKWRHATDGGWFEFEMAVDPAQPVKLLLTYWGGETGNRVFDIVVDGKKIATQKLLEDRPGRFFDVAYPLTGDQTEGKEKVVVRLQAQPEAWAGGLFGARTVRTEGLDR